MNEVFLHVDSEQIEQNKFSLSKSESYHFIKSLRGKIGDIVWLLDGNGRAYQSEVRNIDNYNVEGVIIDSFRNYGESQIDLRLILGLIKGSRMDLAIEKAVEYGVKSIHPIIFERSIRKSINLDRLNKIIISSAKQSGRSFFPLLKEPVKFSNWLEKHSKEISVVCHFSGSSINSIITKNLNSVNIIVGSEGDFSENEISLLRDYDIPFVKLGPRRLRSESACISAILSINQITEL